MLTGCRPPAESSRESPQPAASTPAASAGASAAPADFTYDPATMQPTDEPPPHLTKSQRGQWWVAYNKEMRRRKAEAKRIQDIERRNARAAEEAFAFQQRQEAKVARARAKHPELQAAEAQIPQTNLVPIQPAPVASASDGLGYSSTPSYGTPSYGSSGYGSSSASTGLDSTGSSSLGSGYSGGTTYVRGYYRKDGTYVRGHTRRRRR